MTSAGLENKYSFKYFFFFFKHPMRMYVLYVQYSIVAAFTK